MGSFANHPLADRFAALTPEIVADAIEIDGRHCTGRFTILNSYENRVYQLELDDGSSVVGKFYRPGRWSKDALDDEHDFLFELDDAGIPVAVPLELTAGDDDHLGETIGTLTGEAAGIHFAVFPRHVGRSPHELSADQLTEMGQILAELHDVGESGTADHRPTLNPATYGRKNLDYLLESDALPDGARAAYVATIDALIDRIEPLFANVPVHRIHGDCHLGNIVSTEEGPIFVDFDDLVIGPAVQDVWMLVPSYDAYGREQRSQLLKAYREIRDFDPRWMRLVEPLRALRFVNYATWIARRWHDPTFKRTFTHFGSMRYWQGQIQDLREQIARIDLERDDPPDL